MGKQRITKILGNDVSWYVESNKVTELDEVSIEHIKKCIQDEYNQGALFVSYGKNDEKETSGWWYIVNWEDIALQLRNALPDRMSNQYEVLKAAIKRFDNEFKAFKNG